VWNNEPPNTRTPARRPRPAHCAGEQDKFWEMRAVLFLNAKKLEEENLPDNSD